MNITQRVTKLFFQYLRKEILNEATTIDVGIGTPNWQLCFCLVLAWFCISGILIRGVRSSGKASYFLAVFPYFVMIILLIRSVTLPGSIDGILYFISPKWQELWTAKVWFVFKTVLDQMNMLFLLTGTQPSLKFSILSPFALEALQCTLHLIDSTKIFISTTIC